MRRATMIWLLALALTVSGCAADAGGDGEGDGVASLRDGASDAEPTQSASPAADREEAALAFSQCMREHGMDFPDPDSEGDISIGPEQAEDPDFEEAQEACDPIMETAVGDLQIDPEQEAELREYLLGFSQCMREHGIDFPDPVFEGGRVHLGVPGEPVAFDPQDPAFQEAEDACEEENPGGPGGPDGPSLRQRDGGSGDSAPVPGGDR